MPILKCEYCSHKFSYSYQKWVIKSPFHFFGKRWTKCPYCGQWFWAKRTK